MNRVSPTIRRAFTLLEVLVVIAIIVVLVGIILAVGSAVSAGSERSRAQTTMRILEGALSEWEARSGRQLTWGEDGDPTSQSFYDLQWDTPHVFLISEMLRTVARSSEIQEILAQIGEEQVYRYSSAEVPEWIAVPANSNEPDPAFNQWASQLTATNSPWDGTLTVLDPWERPFRFVHPGRVWREGDPGDPDPDGTIRTDLEDIYGVCVNRRPYLVSSGPSRFFGNLSGTDAQRAAAQDNLYSYEVVRP